MFLTLDYYNKHLLASQVYYLYYFILFYGFTIILGRPCGVLNLLAVCRQSFNVLTVYSADLFIE